MITIYSENNSPRLNYICNIIFKEQLGIEYSVTSNISLTESNCIINYSTQRIPVNAFHIEPNGLLFENDIHEQQIDIFQFNSLINQNKKIISFFQSTSSDFPFDIFSAAFYLLSRYEEYLPYEKDSYGRFSHEQSLAFKNNFLHLPLVNIWIQEFKKALQNKFYQLRFREPNFKAILSYDIDIAWSYKNKGFFRNIGGFLKNPDVDRLKVMLGLKKDPFDAYEWMDDLHKNVKADIIYFFLVAQSISKYDKNISPEIKQMKQLIHATSAKYKVGLHPSWKSNNYQTILNNEKEALENICGKTILESRQHYIQFRLPDTFDHLINSGIQKDFSMGYGSINGFRASFAGSFYWYNLKEESSTTLRLYPFCFMDANSFYEQQQNAKTSFEEIMHYKNECQNVNGLFISIFHNNFLGTDMQFEGWAAMYAEFISQIR
jgi:hypothetical protein